MTKTFVPEPDYDALLHDKLISSGLTVEDGQLLNFRTLTGAESQELGGLPVASFLIPYFRPDDPQKPLVTHALQSQFYRIRWLIRPPDEKQAEKKYLQPKNSGVAAYFPHNAASLRWPDLIDDPDEPLFITEGELKAAKACRAGYPCIGLGGVWNFQSKREGVVFLPELELFHWERRDVYIIYDSDVVNNQQVQRALQQLHLHLLERGARVFMLILPAGKSGEKVGLDDYLLAHNDLDGILDSRLPAPAVDPLWGLNDNYVIVANQEQVRQRRTQAKWGKKNFHDQWGKRMMIVPKITARGYENDYEDMINYWLQWPLAPRVGNLTYQPGAPPLDIVEENGQQAFNTWPGWKVAAKEGDVSLFLELIAHLFHGCPAEDVEWFLSWLAWPLKHPGCKLATSVVLFSIHQGVGKSVLGYVMREIYGENFSEISQRQFESSFNDWVAEKQFIMGDDVSGSDKKREMDLLKKMVTQQTVTVNVKYQKPYTIKDMANYFWTTNRPDAFYLDDHDRRFFIHEVTVAPLPDTFYSAFMHWLQEEGGASAVFHFLLNYDTKDFNPQAKAKATRAKQQMIFITKSDFAQWVTELVTDFEHMAGPAQLDENRDLFTLREIQSAYGFIAGDEASKISSRNLMGKLRGLGVDFVLGGNKVTGPAGHDRYFPLQNVEFWRTASDDDVKKHLHTVSKPNHQGKKY